MRGNHALTESKGKAPGPGRGHGRRPQKRRPFSGIEVCKRRSDGTGSPHWGLRRFLELQKALILAGWQAGLGRSAFGACSGRGACWPCSLVFTAAQRCCWPRLSLRLTSGRAACRFPLYLMPGSAARHRQARQPFQWHEPPFVPSPKASLTSGRYFPCWPKALPGAGTRHFAAVRWKYCRASAQKPCARRAADG